MTCVSKNIHPDKSTGSNKPLSIHFLGPVQILFFLLLLVCSYEKSGIIIGLGSRTISISVGMVIWFAMLILYAFDPVVIKKSFHKYGEMNYSLYKLIVVIVIIQTFASLVGLIYAPGKINFSSEIFYFIQRSGYIVIPLLALRYNISRKAVMKFFLISIFVHSIFIILQFVSPSTYASFIRSVNDSLRLDNSLNWGSTGVLSWDFVGLQRTANFGGFAAGFGLLVLGFTHKNLLHKILRWLMVFLTIFVAFMGFSRSVMIMVTIALFIYAKQRGIISKFTTYTKIASVVIIGSILFSLDIVTLKVDQIAAINAFVDYAGPKDYMGKMASDQGKLALAKYGLQLFERSPIVGWGQRRLADIAMASSFNRYELAAIGGPNAQAHSYNLSLLLSTGVIGLIAYWILSLRILKILWKNHNKDYAIVCGVFAGLLVYNIIYDAGSLSVFMCFNGVAAYYALTSRVI